MANLNVLNSLLQRETLVDQFVSLIWTERYSAFGDFELVTQSTPYFRTLLVDGVRLSLDGAYRVMEIENVEDKTDDEGRKVLSITGRSIEKILLDRIAMTGTVNAEGALKWILTGLPADIVRTIFQKICVEGIVNPGDKIPFITAGNIFPPDTFSEPAETITVELDVGAVYDLIKELCDIYDLGFRLVRGGDDSKLYFNVYTGSDRTSAQSTTPAVVFSVSLDTLTNTSSLTSSTDYKNVAYVTSPSGNAIVYSGETGADVAGFARRVMHVSVDTIPEFVGTAEEIAAQVKTYLDYKGAEALAKQRKFNAFDGKIPENGKYKYGVDYILGDMVEMRSEDGVTKNMRVTENIFVSDAEGERSYPTLYDVLNITPGSWFAWDYNQVWAEAIGTWEEA